MIAKIAVSAANFAIDKPYSYAVPAEQTLKPGMRVTIPFGRGNRRCEGVVLSVEEGSTDGLKAVEQQLDDREKQVISLRYGLGGNEPQRQREVAKILGISRSYVSRIEKRALGKLRKALDTGSGV